MNHSAGDLVNKDNAHKVESKRKKNSFYWWWSFNYSFDNSNSNSTYKKKIEHLNVSKHHGNQCNGFGLGVKEVEKSSDEQRGTQIPLKE